MNEEIFISTRIRSRSQALLQNLLQVGCIINRIDHCVDTYNLITHTLSTQGVSYTIVDPRNFEQVRGCHPGQYQGTLCRDLRKS